MRFIGDFHVKKQPNPSNPIKKLRTAQMSGMYKPIISTWVMDKYPCTTGHKKIIAPASSIACWMQLIWVASFNTISIFWSTELHSRRCFDALPPVWWRWLLARTLDGGNTPVVASDSSRQIWGRETDRGTCDLFLPTVLHGGWRIYIASTRWYLSAIARYSHLN